jgi:hypothetical protein
MDISLTVLRQNDASEAITATYMSAAMTTLLLRSGQREMLGTAIMNGGLSGMEKPNAATPVISLISQRT